MVGEGKSFYICTRFKNEATFLRRLAEFKGRKALEKETKIFIKKVLVDKEKALYICTRFENKQTFKNYRLKLLKTTGWGERIRFDSLGFNKTDWETD